MHFPPLEPIRACGLQERGVPVAHCNITSLGGTLLLTEGRVGCKPPRRRPRFPRFSLGAALPADLIPI